MLLPLFTHANFTGTPAELAELATFVNIVSAPLEHARQTVSLSDVTQRLNGTPPIVGKYLRQHQDKTKIITPNSAHSSIHLSLPINLTP